MLGTQFPDWPDFAPDEVHAATRVLQSNRVNYWTGQECRLFETEFASACGTQHAIAVANGTLALDLCWQSLGVGVGDEVVVTPRTFLASATSIVNAGAVPVFADVDAHSQNITPQNVERVLTPRTKAVLLVHLAGWPCDIDGFKDLANQHNLLLVEDCAQANGARWREKSVGSQSHMAAWSFCQDKIMSTGGEGGMVTTSEPALWSKAWSYKDHGKSWDAVYNREHPPGYRWVHESVGTNWRMLEIQAAIGRLQLQKLPGWHAKRKANAEAIWQAADATGLYEHVEVPVEAVHAWYKAYIIVCPDRLSDGWSRDRIIHEINALGVPCYQGSCSEVYLEKAFDNAPGRPTERLPVAKKLGETSLMFLVHPTLTSVEIARTTAAIADVSRRALRAK